MTNGEPALRRLQDLYEISKLLASFETVEQTFAPVMDIVTRTLPLGSAILLEAENGGAQMHVWSCAGRQAAPTQAIRENAQAAYNYLVGTMTALPRDGDGQGSPARNLIVIPLVVAHRPPFGALQLEGTEPLDKADLIFVNAIANQLAIAVDRDRAWRREIARRQRAEEGQTDAEARGLVAERDRANAVSASHRYETLAADNARLYEQAQQAVRAREQILTVVSHDLRNPLAAILMTTAALTKQGILPRPVGRIQRAAAGMLRLIEDLLDFASIEAGRLAIKRHPQDAGAILQETLATFEGVAQEKELELTADIQPDLPQVYCDHDRLLQVLSNLVGNATKATAAGGKITLRVDRQEQDLLFTVQDSGPGISEDDAKHIFERYWRSGEVDYKGIGLGLAIARGIIRAHGGQIWVQSELGRGATFLFTVPAADLTLLFTVPTPDDTQEAQALRTPTPRIKEPDGDRR